MTAPEDEIETFIERHATMESRRLDVAIGFAWSMVGEMRACTAKWEATERALEEEIRRRSNKREWTARAILDLFDEETRL